MATTAKDTSQGKEKSRSTTQQSDTTPGRKPTKALSTGTSDHKSLTMLEKPSPHYLKPTISSTKDVCKHGKKHPLDDTSLKYSSQARRRSIEKPPSAAQLQRTLSASPRGRTLKPSSPPIKKASPSPKPVERTTMTMTKTTTTTNPKNGRTQPAFTKPVSIKKNTCTTSTKKVTKHTKTGLSSIKNDHHPSIETTGTPLPVMSEEEENGKQVQEVQEETIKVVGEEEKPDHEPPRHEQNLIELDVTEQETNNPSARTVLEEKEPVPNNLLEEETEEKKDEVVQKNELEKYDANEEHNTAKDEIEESHKNAEVVETNDGEEEGTPNQKEACSKEDEANEEKSYKLKFKQGKELAEKEEEDGGSQRLKFKERKVEGESDEGKGDAENVVLKKQDVLGKKESPAYNDVIEETASKLAEKRKSKVLALAGAFETVISLQQSEGQQTEGD